MASRRVVIIGGGIAGLSAAYCLKRLTCLPVPARGKAAGEGQGASIVLVESEPRLGGKILTERVDGFVIEGGPDTFLSLKPRGIDLCRELGLEDRLHGTNERVRRTYVMREGRLFELPEGLTGLIPSRFGPMLRTGLISPLGKLRMGLDYLIPAHSTGGDESLAAFVERRLGRELYDRLVEPLLSGIYAGDGEQLSLAATFPQLRQTELQHGSLIRGMLAAKRSPNGTAPGSGLGNPASRKWPAFVTPTTGLAEIVEALESRLDGVEIRRGESVARVETDGEGYRLLLGSGESIPADSVILATPAHAAAELIAGLDSEMAAAMRAIPHVSTATVSVAYPLRDIPRPLDGYGYIIPRAEGRPVLACTWTSTKFPHRAPEGYGLIRAFIGRAESSGTRRAASPRPDSASDDELLALVRDELRSTLGITAPPVLHRIFRWPKAMPQYTLGHLERLATIERQLSLHPGLFVAGNAYRGIGIPDCIQSGETAAAQAASFIHSMREPLVA